MKKILLTAAAATLLSTSAFAGEDSFFVKANVGMTKFNKIGDKEDGSFKSKVSVPLGLGVGYNVMDNTRVDLTYNTFLNAKHTIKIDKENATLKGTIHTLLLNAFVDVYDASVAKIFVGAGVGVSQVKNKLTISTDGISISNKVKSKMNFSAAGYLGASTEFAEGVHGDLTYSYKYLGHAKDVKSKDSYKGHSVTAGVRFDI